MRILLLFLMMVPSFVFAQEFDVREYTKKATAELGEPIRMPGPGADFDVADYLDDFYSYQQVERIFYIQSEEQYKILFRKYRYTKKIIDSLKASGEYYNYMDLYHVDSLPKIDFSTNNLVLFSRCELCLRNCINDARYNAIHRASCDYKHSWFIKKKVTAVPDLISFFNASESKNEKISTADTTRKRIELPEVEWYDVSRFFEIGRKSSYVYTVDSDSLYQEIFSKYKVQNLPAFDFTKLALQFTVSCSQCLVSCPTNKPCHRNACSYNLNWFLVDK